jgi:hypothetical protein
MKKRSLLALSASVLTFALASSQAGIEGVPKLPPQAFEIEDYTVPGSETLQASFKLKSTYPTSAILEYYAQGLSDEWEACRSQAPGWDTYVSTAAGRDIFVHQVIRYWVNRRQKKMLSLVVRHYSKGSQFRCQPEDDVQYGVVVVSMSPELKKEIALLRLACGEAAKTEDAPDDGQVPVPGQCQ